MYTACKKLPWAHVPSHSAVSTGHGRRARRTIKVLTAPDWIEFPGAAQVAQIRRTVTRAGRKSVEVVYVITSANHRDAPPATLAAWIQNYWRIENQLHWIRDVTFDEDRSQVRTGSAPQVMATLRNTVVNLLRLGGTSHRLFSHISMNWRGRPAVDLTAAHSCNRDTRRMRAPIVVVPARVLCDVEFTLLGVLPAGRELGGPVPRGDAHGRTRLRLDPRKRNEALEATEAVLVDEESTPIARMMLVHASGADRVAGHLVRERHRESGVGRDRALSVADRAAGWERVLILARPLVARDSERIANVDAVLVPDWPASTGDVPTEVMLALAHRLANRLGGAPVRTVPVAWRDSDSDAHLLESLRNWLGANQVITLRDDEPDPNAPYWATARAALGAYISGTHVDLPDADVLAAWRPPRPRRGLVVMFTGLSGSGKSTVARALAHRIRTETTRTVSLLDGDVVRQMLSAGLGFDRESRVLNIRRIGFVAAEVARHGGLSICAPIAPYAETRAEVRAMVEALGDFVLVHVNTPLVECERRDVKGLYAKARAGVLPEFTGISDPYEEPVDADVRVDTSSLSVEAAVGVVYDHLTIRGWL